MVVMVHVGLADDLGHEADVLHLGIDVERTVHDQLHIVGDPVRDVDVGILGLLVDEGLVPLRAEIAPDVGEVLGGIEHRIGLDIEVARVIPAADRQAGNVLQGLVLRVGLGALGVAVVQPDVGGRLEGIVHIGAAVPDAVGLIHLHMVHVDDQRDVHRRVPFVFVDIHIDREGIGLHSLIINTIEAGLTDIREVQPDVVVAVVELAPDIGRDGLGDRPGAIRINAQQASRLRGHGVLVEFGHGHFLLGGRIADLGEADVGRADPVLGDARLQVPFQDQAGLAGGQQRAQHEHTVLREVAAVVNADLRLGAHPHAKGVILRGEHDLMPGGHRQGHEEVSAAAVVEGALTEILRDLLGDGVQFGVVHRGLGQDARQTVHEVVAAEIRGREELEIQAGLADQIIRYGLVQPDLYQHALVLGQDLESGDEIIVLIGERYLHAALVAVDLAGAHHPEDIPLLGGVHQADTTARGEAFAPLNNLQAGEFLIIERPVVEVVVNQHVRAPGFEIAQIVELQALRRRAGRQNSGEGRDDENGKSFHNESILVFKHYYKAASTSLIAASSCGSRPSSLSWKLFFT